MSEHLDLDALADVLAGDGTPEAVRHLDGCPACRAALADLEATAPAVSALLAALPEPPEPPDLAVRLEAALAAERTPRPEATGATAASRTVTPLDGRRRDRSRWLPVAAGVAAAAALVVGGVVVLHGSGSGSRGTGTSASSGAAPDKAAGVPTSSTGNDYGKDGVALQHALPALLRADSTARTTDGAASGAAPSRPGAQLSTTDPLHRLRTTPGLAACLAALTDASDPGLPLALDYARFEGAPALVVVLPSSKSDKVDVFVVGAGCSQADAHLLLFTRLPRPAAG